MSRVRQDPNQLSGLYFAVRASTTRSISALKPSIAFGTPDWPRAALASLAALPPAPAASGPR